MNEFEEWQEKKLKLLHMLEDISAKIRTLLMRKGKNHPLFCFYSLSIQN